MQAQRLDREQVDPTPRRRLGLLREQRSALLRPGFLVSASGSTDPAIKTFLRGHLARVGCELGAG